MPVVLNVVTANVNGIRPALKRGGLEWLAEAAPDVICLQEVRATHEQLHAALAESSLRDWHVEHAPAPQLGRAGVAILTRHAPKASRTDVGLQGLDGLGRWIEADIDTAFGPVTVVSTYVHAGEVGSVRQDEKYAFLEAMDARLGALRSRAMRRKGHVLVTGDLNIAHHEVDIKNWKGNLKNSGFLPQERAYLDRWFAKDWIDLGRVLGGQGPGPYTWWSWRGKGFDTDGGWRIDYVLATPGIAARAVKAEVGKAPTYAERWSDHAPLTVTFV
jgi:exodeoxyribonuclease III